MSDCTCRVKKVEGRDKKCVPHFQIRSDATGVQCPYCIFKIFFSNFVIVQKILSLLCRFIYWILFLTESVKLITNFASSSGCPLPALCLWTLLARPLDPPLQTLPPLQWRSKVGACKDSKRTPLSLPRIEFVCPPHSDWPALHTTSLRHCSIVNSWVRLWWGACIISSVPSIGLYTWLSSANWYTLACF